MSKLSALEELIKPREYSFQPRSIKDNGQLPHLFCTRCGVFKPRCLCDSLSSQLDLLHKE